jgi:hypothetical protein
MVFPGDLRDCLGSLYQVPDIKSCDCDREESDRCQNRIASTYVVGDYEGIVTAEFGQRLQGSF